MIGYGTMQEGGYTNHIATEAVQPDAKDSYMYNTSGTSAPPAPDRPPPPYQPAPSYQSVTTVEQPETYQQVPSYQPAYQSQAPYQETTYPAQSAYQPPTNKSYNPFLQDQ